jgi:uncharacterized membrane protein
MEAGKTPSAIVRALRWIKHQTDVDVRVLVFEPKLKWFCRDLMERALREFDELGLYRSPQRMSVLLYFDRSSQKFVLLADEGFHRTLGQKMLEEFAGFLEDDLRSTEFENAVSLNLYALGHLLKDKDQNKSVTD